MRPIFNFVDNNDDPFPPVNRDNPRRSLLPRASLASQATNRNSIAPSNRPSFAHQPNRPSTTSSRRQSFSLAANKKQSSSTSRTSSSVAVDVTKQQNKPQANNGRMTSQTASAHHSKSINKLSTIKERQSEGTSHCETPEEMEIISGQHLQLETTIEANEKKLNALLEGCPSSLQNLGKMITSGDWQGSGDQLGELLEISAKLGSKVKAMAYRREMLKLSRESWLKAMDNYSEYLIEELSNASEMKERLNELLSKLKGGESETGPPSCDLQNHQKPLMMDKGVQAIPERTTFTSPNFTSSIRRTQIPSSPVLRTGKKGQHCMTPLRAPLETIESSDFKENDFDSVIGTPKRWNPIDRPIPPLSFDDTTVLLKKEPAQDAYVLQRPTIHNGEATLPRNVSTNEIHKPATPVLLTDSKRNQQEIAEKRDRFVL